MINLLLLSNNFYLVISYRRVQKESDELLYRVWSLVMVRNPIASARGEANEEINNQIINDEPNDISFKTVDF